MIVEFTSTYGIGTYRQRVSLIPAGGEVYLIQIFDSFARDIRQVDVNSTIIQIWP
jgi:hypothetical protein